MNTLYEHSTLASLMAGNFDGTITLKDLLTHGSYGLGTFSGLDGEVIILDNEVYQATSSGKVNHITDMNTKLPFASVHFPKDLIELSPENADFNYVNQTLVKEQKLQNVFAAIQLKGSFPFLHTRIAPKQEKPYPSLLEVAQNQPEFTFEDLTGTIIGYYAPAIFGSVTASGWHLHFISDDHQIAGHVLDFKAENLSGNLEIFDTLQQHFPINDSDFRDSEVDLASVKEGIEKSEGSSNK
ncbi:acetolactate decarboxylase [uncultured Lactobacillus sp.]|uniref:acetolactate decarboxylase n=1 Tax=uncultured Lactobacillus sp. TaxID=153152 RepID=UPI00262B98A1|nr:acetolactate decarboxylase [uncultured Lactobacillus sp.]